MRRGAEFREDAIQTSVERAPCEDRLCAGLAGVLEGLHCNMGSIGENMDGAAGIEGFPAFIATERADEFERGFGGVEIDDEGPDGGVGEAGLEHVERTNRTARKAETFGGFLDPRCP